MGKATSRSSIVILVLVLSLYTLSILKRRPLLCTPPYYQRAHCKLNSILVLVARPCFAPHPYRHFPPPMAVALRLMNECMMIRDFKNAVRIPNPAPSTKDFKKKARLRRAPTIRPICHGHGGKSTCHMGGEIPSATTGWENMNI